NGDVEPGESPAADSPARKGGGEKNGEFLGVSVPETVLLQQSPLDRALVPKWVRGPIDARFLSMRLLGVEVLGKGKPLIGW
ncbi:hypothetical protein JTE90_009296, partial [Oedothorax gibbosus]